MTLYIIASMLLAGCRFGISFGAAGYLSGEDYPNAEQYQAGAFSYSADAVTAVEVYWRSGEVEIVESEDSELRVAESGSSLAEDAALHYFLDGGTLRIRFCASGAKICVDALDKQRAEAPISATLRQNIVQLVDSLVDQLQKPDQHQQRREHRQNNHRCQSTGCHKFRLFRKAFCQNNMVGQPSDVAKNVIDDPSGL